MKKSLNRSTVANIILLSGLCFSACTKHTTQPVNGLSEKRNAGNMSSIRTDSFYEGEAVMLNSLISPHSFSLWQSCSTKPYYIQGTNGICVPVGGTACSPNYLGAQQNGGQYATGMQFTGCFKGGSNAPDGSNEMAVFICDNVTSWTGREMGFVKTLNDNVLKAYLQSPGQYIYQSISTGDNGYHTFKCQVNYNNHSQVDFYVDGNYVLSLQNPGVNYWGNWYYFVGTTHRTSGGWPSNGQQIEMYDMTTY